MRLLGCLLAAVLLAAVPLACGDSGSATARKAPRADVDRFDSEAAWRILKRQVALGPRPAGSAASRKLARRLKRLLPRGRYQRVPGGLRNVVGKVRGRGDGYVVVGAHYDTKDIDGFVGANDGASGTAVVVELARSLQPRKVRPTVVFVLFDGEESPRGTPDAEFVAAGLRGSRAAAPRYEDAEAMILLDFVGDRNLRIPREAFSDARLWRKLRSAARRVGVGRVFPKARADSIYDDHVPFLELGVPAIDLIDFNFPCFHKTCDDLDVVSERSLDAVGEAVRELLASL